MKNLIISFLILHCSFHISQRAMAQGCLPEGIYFTAQTQVDSFQFNYPGCTEIEGNVVIGGIFNDITNLNGLNILTAIGGDLAISYLWESCDLTGLENISNIGGSLSILNNDNLTSLTGLGNLVSIGGDLSIGDGSSPSNDGGNDGLTNITGLENLTSIGGCLRIGGNDNLEDASGLNALTYVGGCISILRNSSLTSLSGLDNIDAASITDLYIKNNYLLSTCNVLSICNYLASPNGIIDIYHNAPACNNPPEIASGCGISMPCLPYGNYNFFSQSDLDNFQTNYPGCTELGGNVNIAGIDIVNITALNQITSVGGSLLIGIYPYGYNLYLNSLAGLENLTQIGGDLCFGHNDTLTSFDGLDNLASIGGSLLIGLTGGGSSSGRSMKALSSIEALRNLTIIPGDLYIAKTALTSLYGLDSVSFIGADITIGGNYLLTDISNLDNLTCINGSLRIYDAAILNFSGLNHVSTIAGSFRIGWNHCIKDFGGLENLTSIGGWAWISDNDSLISMAGLNGLVSMGDYLWVSGNNRLTSLTGLEALSSLPDLSIIYNPLLITLTGLENISSNTLSSLEIRDNSSLSDCEVQSICNYLISPNGTVNIHDNAPGCNSPEEVEAACGLGVEESAVGGLQSAVEASPNPFHSSIEFQVSSIEYQRIILKIYNAQGQEVATVLDGKWSGDQVVRWDASNLPAGVYYYRLTTDDRRLTTGKIVKY